MIILFILLIIIAVAALIICGNSQRAIWMQTAPEHIQKQRRDAERDAGRILVRNEASAWRFLRKTHIHTCYAGHGRCSTYNGGPCREETLANYADAVVRR